ncbi:hypothetical protein CHS0354_008579, partial [Potamilus streckersoni]
MSWGLDRNVLFNNYNRHTITKSASAGITKATVIDSRQRVDDTLQSRKTSQRAQLIQHDHINSGISTRSSNQHCDTVKCNIEETRVEVDV